jgi:hypothetical protein
MLHCPEVEFLSLSASCVAVSSAGPAPFSTCVQLWLITILGNCGCVAVACFLGVPSPIVINRGRQPNYWRNTRSEIDVCDVGSSDHLLLWIWRRGEKRAAGKELDVWCMFELARAEVDFGSKT